MKLPRLRDVRAEWGWRWHGGGKSVTAVCGIVEFSMAGWCTGGRANDEHGKCSNRTSIAKNIVSSTIVHVYHNRQTVASLRCSHKPR